MPCSTPCSAPALTAPMWTTSSWLRHTRRGHRQQHRTPDCAQGGPAHHGFGRHRQPLLLVGFADHRHGRPAHHRGRGRCVCGRWCGEHLLRAARDEPAHDSGPGPGQAKPEIYWSMLQTAEQVAKRYNIGREAMDEYGAGSQQRPVLRRLTACLMQKSRPSPSPQALPTRRWA